MSVKKPGSNVKTPAIIRKILSSIFILVLKYPVNPTDTQVIPIIAVIIFGITVIPGLISLRVNGQIVRGTLHQIFLNIVMLKLFSLKLK